MMFKHFIEESWDEISDFFEDYLEVIFQKDDWRKHKEKAVYVNGTLTHVKPAYLFAERLDQGLKVVFGISIIASAFAASYVGFIKLSDLIDVLINNFFGRILMVIIGVSYFLLGTWKLIHIEKK